MENEFSRCIPYRTKKGNHNPFKYLAAYEAVYGPRPKNSVLHHWCWNSCCVNGYHLVAVTRSLHSLLHSKHINGLTRTKDYAAQKYVYVPRK